MGLCRSSVFLLGFLLLQQSHSSLVKLNNNGYEDIVIAIDPIVPEDEALIEKIQDMVTEASEYLFEATEQRFFFKNVSILIPWTWKENPQYKDPKYESFTRADVKVAPPVVAGEDDPYTRQFKECGEQADYIHFTPDFVLGNKQDEYGPSGRVFVHEWAHLRWGVFDEYNNDEPFYRDSSNKIEATRCSADITGTNAVYVCSGGSCVNRRCRTNSTTNLYEKDCQFFPDKDQLQKASIMYMQSIESITEFCNEKNHNQEAPSLQNKKCDSRSTWEVISVSEDFRNTTPMVELPPPTAFSLLRSSQRILCLVLDKSGSMGGYDRLNRMNQAATYFLLQVIEYASLVGMVHFSSVATTQSELIQITSSSERDQLKNTLPSVASGGTCICCGITKAFEVFRRHNSQIDGCEIVLLTDGEDSTAGNCINEVAESGTIVHLIALGPNAELAVKNMPTITGGTHYYASDEAQNNGLMDAFGSLASGNTDLFQKSIQLESKGLKLNSNTWMNDTVIIDSTVGNDTFFLITWQKQQPEISLLDPNGTSMNTFTVDSASKMAYLSVPGTAKVGIWTYSVQAKADSEILTITITSRAANSTVPPITVNAKMSKDSNSFPNPMVVYAEVLQGYTPVLGANVTAYIESQTGTTQVLQLWDNGAGADVFKNDGVYSRYFTNYTENGRYSLKVRAYGGTNSATRSLQRPLNRAIYIPGWVVNGVIEGKPPRPETNEATQTTLENFSRAVSGGAFVISNVSNNPFEDHYPPSQITDLDATFDGDEITLSWTAPGENFDSGTAQRYIIRTSKNILHLRDNFTNALLVNTTALSPKEANSKETFRFKPENAEEENTTFIFVAIQSVDKSNLHSKISNIAQVALFIPEADPGPEENPGSGGNPGSDGNPSQSGVNISVMVLSVVGSVVVVTVIVSTTICILNKRRARLQRVF